MQSMLLLLMGLTLSEAFQQNKLHYTIEYTDTVTEKKERDDTIFTECPRERKLPEFRVVGNDIKVRKCAQSNITSQAITCTQGGWCFPAFHIPTNLGKNGISISIGWRYHCPHKNNFLQTLLQWGTVRIQLTCARGKGAVIEAEVKQQAHGLTYSKQLKLNNRLLHIYAKLLPSNVTENQGPRRRVDKVFMNAEEITSIKKHNVAIADHREDFSRIHLGSYDHTHSTHALLLTADFIHSQGNHLDIYDEYQYMELLVGGVPYPECLCPPGTGVEGTDMCSDGTGRLTQEPDQHFLPVSGLHDGIINSSLHYGSWGAPRTKLNVSLMFEAPALLSELVLYLPIQSFTIYKDSLAPENMIQSVLFDKKNHRYSNPNPRWEELADQSAFQRFVLSFLDWDSDIITTSLHLAFSGDRYVNYNTYPSSLREYNMLYEFIIYGSMFLEKMDDDRCSCFPGNGQKIPSCDECNRCRCRDGHISHHRISCAPYIVSVLPKYGPMSGGTVVTIKGKLLRPHLKQDVKLDVNMGIGGGNYTRLILHTDEAITYQTRPGHKGLSGKPMIVLVQLTVDGVRYRVDQKLNFTFLPDPIIEHVTPYRGYLTGGSNITIVGQFLNSVSLHVTKKILTVAAADSKGECSIQSSQKMICTMPEFEQTSTLRTSIGLELDGVERYRNLSNVFPNKAFVIYPQPVFYIGASEYRNNIVTLKGRNLKQCCSRDDYNIFINGEICVVLELDDNILICDISNLNRNAEMYSIIVSVDGFEFRLGYVHKTGVVEFNSLGIIGTIAGTTFVFVVALLCIAILFWRWRRNAQPVPTQCIAMSAMDNSAIPDPTPSTVALGIERDIWADLSPALQKAIRATLFETESIVKHKRIGKGNFGKVFHGTITVGGEPVSVAMKTLKDGTNADIEEIEDFLNEATVMRDFKHPNVLSLIGVILNPRDLYVVLPYMINGDLRKYAARQMFDFKIFHQFTLDIANGMKYLASKHFVHRDLAARNCMVNVAGVVLIGDFGLAKDIYVADYYRPEGRNKPMPFKWMAPECLDERLFTSKSDTWAYGVTMWETYSQGDRPYPMVENLDLMLYLLRGHRLERPANCPIPIFHVMQRCWEMDADLRPDFTELVELLVEAATQVLNDLQHSLGGNQGTATVQVETTKARSHVQAEKTSGSWSTADAYILGTSRCPLLPENDGWTEEEDSIPNYPAPVPKQNELFPNKESCEGAVGGTSFSSNVCQFSTGLTDLTAGRAGSSSEDEDGYLKPVKRSLQRTDFNSTFEQTKSPPVLLPLRRPKVKN